MHNQFLKVEGHNGLVRDTSSGAIINTNTTEYNRYLKQRELASKKEKQLDLISQHEQSINNINNELTEIKGLLLQLLKNKD